MKYTLPSFFSKVCYNTGINNIWVLDAHESDYFRWEQSNESPRLIVSSDTENICISCASMAVSEDSIATCVYPSASSLIESFGPLFEFNRERTPMVIACVIDDYDLSPENIILPIIRDCNFFVQIITDIADIENMVRHAIQYSYSESKVSIILISSYLLNEEIECEKIANKKSIISKPIIIPCKKTIEEIASIINEFEDITIVCGSKCENSLDKINELSLKINAPVIYTPELRRIIEEQVTNTSGVYGRWANPIAYEAITGCDLIIIFDYSHKNFIDINKNIKIIHISPLSLTDTDPLNVHRTYCGNIKETLFLINPLIKKKTDTKFLNKISKLKDQYFDIINNHHEETIPKVLTKLADLISEKIDKKAYLCSEGEYAFFFQNILLKPKYSNNIFHLDELRNEGSLLPILTGLTKNSGVSEVVGMLDSEILNSHLSCFFNLLTEGKKIKILAFNKHPEENNNKSNLAKLCKSTGIEYHFVDKTSEMSVIIDQWYDFSNISVIEIFLNITDKIMMPTFAEFDFDIPEHIIEKVSESLDMFDVGTILFRNDIPNVKELNSNFHQMYINRNVFYTAAGTYAASKKIPVCIINSLYDLLHMLPGILEAKRQYIPIMILAFNGASDMGSRFYKENFIFIKLINTISAFHQIVNLKEDLNLYIGDSISEAIQLNDISTLIFQNYTNFKDSIECRVMFDPSYSNSHVYPSIEIIKEISELINKASNPIIFAGNHARDYKEEIINLSNYLCAPIGWTLRSKDAFDNSEYAIGSLGIISHESTKNAISNSDLIILIGIEFSFSQKINPNAKIIQIDKEALNLGLIPNVDYEVVGDIRDTINYLIKYLDKKPINVTTTAFVKLYKDQHNEYFDSIIKNEEGSNRLTFEGIILSINKSAPDNSWFIADMTLPWFISSLIIEGKGTRSLTYTGENVYSSNSSGFAIGLDLVNKDASKIVITTDISFVKQIDNLRKAIIERVNLKIIIIHLSASDDKVFFSHLINNNDLSGFVIEKREELTEKLKFALAAKGLVIIDFFLDKSELNLEKHLLPRLIGKHTSVVDKIYSNLEKTEYNKRFGMLPSSLIDNI